MVRPSLGGGAGCFGRLSIGAACLSAAGCFSPAELPAPAHPAKEMPPIGEHLGPGGPGQQWVILDTPEDHALVQDVGGVSKRDLCVTPCALPLPIGSHPLIFTSNDNPSDWDNVSLDLRGEIRSSSGASSSRLERPGGSRWRSRSWVSRLSWSGGAWSSWVRSSPAAP
jgi:hypothetical protein